MNWTWRKLTSFDLSIPNAKISIDDPGLGYRMYTLAEPLQPGASLTIGFRTAYESKGFVDGRSNTNVVANGTFLNNRDYFPHLGYNSRDELQDATSAASTACRRWSGRSRPAIRAAAPMNNVRPRLGLAESRHHRQHQRRSDRPRAGRPAARVDRERPPLLPLQDHHADPGILVVPVGALRGEARPVARTVRDRDRDLLRPQARLQRRPDDLCDQKVARLLHGELFALSAPAGAHPGVPRLREFRPVVPEHDPLSPSPSDSSPTCAADALDYVFYVTAHEVAHQWWAHQVIPGERAGGDHARRVDGAVLRAHGDGEGIRPRQDAEVTCARSSTATSPAAASEILPGNAADAGREPGLHPLQQGRAGHVRAARRDRRGAGEPRAGQSSQGPRLLRSAVHERRSISCTTSAPKRRRRSRS